MPITMSKYNQVKEEGNFWVKVDNEKYMLGLKEKDRLLKDKHQNYC